MKSIQQWINYTRTITIIHSILIVLSSLYIYSCRSVSIHTLVDSSGERKDMISDIIEDRRLIATLVSSQASIFCPLFLLINTSEDKPASVTFVFEMLFECIMPIGLAISWFFCSTFNYHVSLALNTDDYWIEKVLIQSVISVLVAETALIFIQLPSQIRRSYKGGDIQLNDEEYAEKN